MTETSSRRIPIESQAFIFIFAFAVRAAFVLAQQRWSVFFGGDLPSPDTRVYMELARSILHGFGFASPGPVGWKESGYPFAVGATAWVMPGYSMFLAGWMALFGDAVLLIRLAQCAVGAIACVFIARIGAGLFGMRAGILAGLLSAVYYELVFLANALVTDALYTCLVAAMLWTLIDAVKRPSDRGRFIASGIVFGVAALVRPEAAGVAAVSAGVMAYLALRQDRPIEWNNAVAFIATVLLVLLPWGVRNQISLGRFNLLSNESGYVLWLGNNAGYDRLAFDYSRFGGYSPAAVFAPLPETKGRSEPDVDRIYRSAAVQHIVAHPLLWIARAPHKLWNMWRPTEVTSSTRHRVIAMILYPTLMIGAAVGAWVSRRTPAVWPLHVFIIGNIALHAAVTGELRFRTALWPALIPLAALTLERAAASFRSRA